MWTWRQLCLRQDTLQRPWSGILSCLRKTISLKFEMCSMDCLQLSFIRVEEAVSWTQRFLTRKFGPKIDVYYDKQIWKQMFAKSATFQVNRKKNGTGRRRLTSSNRAAIFVSTFMRRTTQQTLLTINLASQQKTTKRYFSSQVRK